jgi:hypothetical protein
MASAVNNDVTRAASSLSQAAVLAELLRNTDKNVPR